MARKPSKRAIDEEQWMRTPAGRLIVRERRLKRAIKAAERGIRICEETRRLFENGFLTEDVYREIVGDQEGRAREVIAWCEEMLSAHEGN